VPSDGTIQVQATLDSSASAPARATGLALVDVTGRALTWRDLVFGAAAVDDSSRASLVLTLVAPDGRPVAGAEVRVAPDGDYRAASDDGRLRLSALPRRVSLDVRALGYEPATVAIDVADGRTTERTVTLRRSVAQSLASVRVVGTAGMSREAIDFETRRLAGGGFVIDAAQIDRRSASRVTQLLRGVPGLRIERTSPTGVTVTSTRSDRGAFEVFGGSCPIAWLLDGRQIHVDGSDAPGVSRGGAVRRATAAGAANDRGLQTLSIDDFVDPTEIAAIEVYAGMNGPPARFGVFRCGVVMIWTKETLGRPGTQGAPSTGHDR
jgi:Carboxypeptidase regulatory-like domain/TonB-dependent Receptor Plug Domain